MSINEVLHREMQFVRAFVLDTIFETAICNITKEETGLLPGIIQTTTHRFSYHEPT